MSGRAEADRLFRGFRGGGVGVVGGDERRYVGKLVGYEGGDVTIEINGRSRTFVKSTVAQVRLHITF